MKGGTIHRLSDLHSSPRMSGTGTYSGHGAFSIAKSNTNIPSLGSASIVSAVGSLGNVDWLVIEVDLAGRVALCRRDIGTSCRAN